jgi:hypothetical protein
MELAPLIFSITLLLVGVWLILLVRNYLRKAQAARESDGGTLREAQSISMTARQRLNRVRASVPRKQADPWESITPSTISDAFKNFFRDENDSGFDSSLVNEAFEKFMKGM